jgi:hypothetical protein
MAGGRAHHPQRRRRHGRGRELWLGCRLCNAFKSDPTQGTDPETEQQVRLFDPRRQHWSEHFEWSQDGTRVIGKTLTGRVTVLCLQLNNSIAVMVRHEWVKAGWHPPAMM